MACLVSAQLGQWACSGAASAFYPSALIGLRMRKSGFGSTQIAMEAQHGLATAIRL